MRNKLTNTHACKNKDTRTRTNANIAVQTGALRAKMTRVPDLCCRDGLRPLLGFPGRLVPPDSGWIQSGILCYLGGPDRSREGGVRGCFWSSAESKAGRLKPDLVMLQPPAPPASRPPSARHVTAREQQENAEGLRWKSHRQAPNRP